MKFTDLLTAAILAGIPLAATAAPEDASIVRPFVIITPHLQDLGSENIIAHDPNLNANSTTITLILDQDAKGKLTGVAEFVGTTPDPLLSFPVTIPVKGSVKGKAKGVQYGIEESVVVRLKTEQTVLFKAGTMLYHPFPPHQPPVHFTLQNDTVVTLPVNAQVVPNNNTTVTLNYSTTVRIPAGTQAIGDDDVTPFVFSNEANAIVPGPIEVYLPGLKAYSVINGEQAPYTYSLKGKVSVPTASKPAKVSLAMSGNLNDGVLDVIPLNETDGLKSTIPYTAITAVKGIPTFSDTQFSLPQITGKNRVMVKPVQDTTGLKPLKDPFASRYFEVTYPGGSEVVVGTLDSVNGNITLTFKGKNISGTISGVRMLMEDSVIPEVFNPTAANITTKSGTEALQNVIRYFEPFPPGM